MTIAFVHNGSAILPEIAAYRQYFEKMGYQTRVCRRSELRKLRPDIEWHFMGLDIGPRPTAQLIIHEYASLSTGRFNQLKDLAKKWLNRKPNFRIFINEYTKNGFRFSDGVPDGIREMIFLPNLPGNLPSEKKYNFIYAGSTDSNRQPENWLRWFAPGGCLEKRSVLVLGPKRPNLEHAFPYPWIEFHDTVHPTEVINYLKQAQFGINYQPDVAPFNEQPSAKMLAYAAARLPIITTNYAWVQHFQRNYGGRYFFIPKSGTLSWEALNNFRFEFPDLANWTLEVQLERSGVLDLLTRHSGLQRSV